MTLLFINRDIFSLSFFVKNFFFKAVVHNLVETRVIFVLFLIYCYFCFI